MEVRIEAASPLDLDKLTELLEILFAAGEDFAVNHSKQRAGIEAILADPGKGRIFVMRNDHLLIGMVSVLFTVSTAEGGVAGIIEDLVVIPDLRRQGHGSRLLEYALDFSQKRGLKRLTILTDRNNPATRDFFTKFGFVSSSMIPMRKIL